MQNFPATYIQRTIQQGKLKFDTPQKMKVDDNPFPKDQNMVDAKLLKGKTKVLTSTRAKELEQLIQRCKYRLMNIGKLKGCVTNKRADMSRERHREMGR